MRFYEIGSEEVRKWKISDSVGIIIFHSNVVPMGVIFADTRGVLLAVTRQ